MNLLIKKCMEKQFASRAGQKLQHAIESFHIDVSECTCADFGCSTGGFVDCLLQNKAKKVYAIDTGYGVLDWNLRQNPKVVVMERINAIHVELSEQVDFISIDVGWTPQKLIIPSAIKHLTKNGNIVSLLKPQYEAEKAWLRGGKVSTEFLEQTIKKVRGELSMLGVTVREIIESPIAGKKGGNIEYLLWIKK